MYFSLKIIISLIIRQYLYTKIFEYLFHEFLFILFISVFRGLHFLDIQISIFLFY